MANDPLRPIWTETTPDPAAAPLSQTRAVPPAWFERAFALVLFTLAAALIVRGFC